jgi:hypothetical protein
LDGPRSLTTFRRRRQAAASHSRAPDGLLGRWPTLDILRVVEAYQVGRLLVPPDPELPAVAAQARVGGTLGEPGLVGDGRPQQLGELAAGVAHVPVSCLLRPEEQERDVVPGTVLGALERVDAGHGHTVAGLVLPHADVLEMWKRSTQVATAAMRDLRQLAGCHVARLQAVARDGGCRIKPIRNSGSALAEVHARAAVRHELETDGSRASEEMAVFGAHP